MRRYNVFDIIGPIMIGPSSSHTAGAARLAKVARTISGKDIKKVRFLLHGSFAATYKGHGTDRALAAGILGMEPSDVRLRESLQLAEEMGIELTFEPTDLGDVHPNTVKFIITTATGEVHEVQGSSIGGGNIEINEIDNEKCTFTGAYPTLIIAHKDIPGAIAKVTGVLYENNINIAFMRVFRKQRGEIATMIFETDSFLKEDVHEKIKVIDEVESVIVINPIKEGEE